MRKVLKSFLANAAVNTNQVRNEWRPECEVAE